MNSDNKYQKITLIILKIFNDTYCQKKENLIVWIYKKK